MKHKKLISAILLVMVLFSSYISVSAATEHRLTDDFEGYMQSSNEAIDGVTKWTSPRPIVTENGNKSAIIGAGNGDSLYSTTSGFSSDVTGVIANFSIKFNNDVKQHVIFGVSGSSAPASASNRVLQFYAGGAKMQIKASTDVPISYSAGKWYDITVKLNFDTGYYHLSVNDGASTKTWSSLSSGLTKTAEEKAKLKYFTFWIDNNAKTESVQIDNVDIYGVTGNRIYPESSVSEDFSAFTSIDGTGVPEGFMADGVTGVDNGFVSSDGKLNFVSASGASLSLAKTVGTELSPGNVKIKLSKAASPEFKIRLKDTAGNEALVDVSSDGFSADGESANADIGAGAMSLSIKDGKLYAGYSDSTNFAALECTTNLTGIKSFSIESAEDETADILISEIFYGTVKYFEASSSSVDGGKVLPDTNIITLDFSNSLMPHQGDAFAIEGDREIESVDISGDRVTITLNEKLSPNYEYILSYNNLYDTDAVPVSGTVSFKTDIALRVDNFGIENPDDTCKLDIVLKSNTGETKDVIVLLTVYDGENGKIISVDFEKLTVTENAVPCSVSVPKPSEGSYSVEAYIWDGLDTMNSLGYSDILTGGGVQ